MRKQFKKWCARSQVLDVANGPGLDVVQSSTLARNVTAASTRVKSDSKKSEGPPALIVSRRGRETCLGHRLRLVA